MHWLIPAVSHSILSLLAWSQQGITLTAIVLSFGVAASQSIHLWSAFYGLFVPVFLAHLATGAGARDARPNFQTGSASTLLASFLMPTFLVPLHQYYFGLRVANVPWFHITRAPGGCLPIPSRTHTQPFNYGFTDAIGNQLPYGVVASYAVAMAQLLWMCTRKQSSGGRFVGLETLAAVVGACIVTSVAAYALPFCGPDDRDGSHQVAMHVDRSVDWNERTIMRWSTASRYGWFVIPLSAVGVVGALAMAGWSTITPRKLDQPARVDVKARVSSEKAALREVERSPHADGIPRDGIAVDNSGEALRLLSNALLTGTVILCMALWSWSGPRLRQEALLPGMDILLGADI